MKPLQLVHTDASMGAVFVELEAQLEAHVSSKMHRRHEALETIFFSINDQVYLRIDQPVVMQAMQMGMSPHHLTLRGGDDCYVAFWARHWASQSPSPLT